LEFTLKYSDTLTVVGDHFLFRLMAREVALSHGIILTCLLKPFLGQGGSGVHVNLSFFDKDGKNAFGDPSDAHNMSALTKGCVAGFMKHHCSMAG
jgi:glutamine synthetase